MEKENQIIHIANAFILSKQDTSPIQKRLVAMFLQQVGNTALRDEELLKGFKFFVSGKEFNKFYGLSRKDINSEIRIAIDDLYERSFSKGGNHKGRYIYDKDEPTKGNFEIIFHPEFIKLIAITSQQRAYTKILLCYVKSFKSHHSIRLLELLSIEIFKEKRDFIMSFDEFRELFNIEDDKYKSIPDIRKLFVRCGEEMKEEEVLDYFKVKVSKLKGGMITISYNFNNKVLEILNPKSDKKVVSDYKPELPKNPEHHAPCPPQAPKKKEGGIDTPPHKEEKTEPSEPSTVEDKKEEKAPEFELKQYTSEDFTDEDTPF